MMDLIQITNEPDVARRCDALPGMRVFVDLEVNGKAQRQAGRNTFISTHQLGDVGKMRSVVTRSPLMVRVNPLHAQTPQEVDAVLAQGPDLLMLPMFSSAQELRSFTGIVAGRVPVVALLETEGALLTLSEWIDTPGLIEVFVGLNDLHLSLGRRFMFEPLAEGLIDQVAQLVHERGLRFGFGGIARLDEGLLPGRDVLSEHVRLGSHSVILSRTFHASSSHSFELDVGELRLHEEVLRLRPSIDVSADRERVWAAIAQIVTGMGASA